MSLTPQQFFDNALFGIRAQGGPAYNAGLNKCFYRMPSGEKCNFGHNISDKDYKPEMEKQSLHSDTFRSWFENNPQIHQDFAASVQNIHDWAAKHCYREGTEFMLMFEEQMEQFALMNNLDYTPPA